MIYRNKQRGAAALLEAALTMGVLLAVMMGIIDFSRALYAYHFVSHAAREATRYASVRGASWTAACTAPTYRYQCMTDTGGADMLAYVNSLVPAGIQVSGTKNTSGPTTCGAASTTVQALSVCSVWPGYGGGGPSGTVKLCDPTTVNNPQCVVQVTVQYNFKFIFNSLGILPHGSYYTLSSTSQMVIAE